MPLPYFQSSNCLFILLFLSPFPNSSFAFAFSFFFTLSLHIFFLLHSAGREVMFWVLDAFVYIHVCVWLFPPFFSVPIFPLHFLSSSHCLLFLLAQGLGFICALGCLSISVFFVSASLPGHMSEMDEDEA